MFVADYQTLSQWFVAVFNWLKIKFLLKTAEEMHKKSSSARVTNVAFQNQQKKNSFDVKNFDEFRNEDTSTGKIILKKYTWVV